MNAQKYKAKLAALDGKTSMPKLKDDPEALMDMKELLDSLFKCMASYYADYGIKWMIGLKRYLEDKKGSISRPFTGNPARGHIVEVDLFGHFNRELTFIHPAVVLYENNEGWMLIAPISTSKHGSPNSLHIDVDENDGLKHPCGVCVTDIRVIDKSRVLFQHESEGKKSKLRPEKLDEIDNAILQNYLPIYHQRFLDLESTLLKEQEEHANTKAELQRTKELLAKMEVAATEKT